MQDIDAYQMQYLDALTRQNIGAGIRVIRNAIEDEIPPEDILAQVIDAAMTKVRQLYLNKEVTLTEIYVTARISERAVLRVMDVMDTPMVSEGTVVIGTMYGDHHGLGSKIVSMLLQAACFDTHHLGLSVSSTEFVDAAVRSGASIICVSTLLLHTAENVSEVRQLLRERRLENQIKLVVGGAPFNFDDRLYLEVGADATARNAAEAVATVRSLVEGLK